MYGGTDNESDSSSGKQWIFLHIFYHQERIYHGWFSLPAAVPLVTESVTVFCGVLMYLCNICLLRWVSQTVNSILKHTKFRPYSEQCVMYNGSKWLSPVFRFKVTFLQVALTFRCISYLYVYVTVFVVK
jgi:hypothetical protein